MERRLAAILAADVAGYTALMGVDEDGTHRRLTELRRQVLEPLIAAQPLHAPQFIVRLADPEADANHKTLPPRQWFFEN